VKRGLLESAQALLDDLLALARTRLELFGTELEAALARLVLALLGAIAVLLLIALAAGFFGAALLIALPAEERLTAAATIGAGFFALAVATGWTLHRRAVRAPHPFDASLGELDRDRHLLKP